MPSVASPPPVVSPAPFSVRSQPLPSWPVRARAVLGSLNRSRLAGTTALMVGMAVLCLLMASGLSGRLMALLGLDLLLG